MMRPRLSRFVLATTFATMLAIALAGATPALAEDGADREAREVRKKITNMMGMLRSQGELLAAKQARQQAGTDPASGQPNNLVYQASPEDARGAAERVRKCLNPPGDLRATYSVAIIHSDEPRSYVDPFDNSPDLGRIAFDKEKYVGQFMKKVAPAPRVDGKPAVRMAFDVGDGGWAYALGPGWKMPAKAKQLLDERIGHHRRTSDDSVGDDVCLLVDDIEGFLDDVGQRDIGEFFKMRVVRQSLDETRDHLEAAREILADVLAASSDTTPFERQSFAPKQKKAQDKLEAAEQAVGAWRLAEATKAAHAADQWAGAAFERASYAEALSKKAHQRQRAIDQFADALWLRDETFLPHGEAIAQKTQSCRKRIEAFVTAVGTGQPIERMEQAEQASASCLSRVQNLVHKTRSDFVLKVYVIPGVVFGLLMVAVPMLMSRRRQQIKRRRFDLDGQLEQWRIRVPDQADTLEAMHDEYADLLRRERASYLLDAAAIERIDLAFVLVDRAAQIRDRAEQWLAATGTFDDANLDKLSHLLGEATTSVGPQNSAGQARIQDCLRQTHAVQNAELLDTIDELTREMAQALQDAARAEYDASDQSPPTW